MSGPERPRGLGGLRLRLTRIERYVLIRTLWAVAGALAIISAVVMLIDFVEISRNTTAGTDTTIIETLGLTLLRSPNLVLLLLPFAFLFGVLAAYVNLNRRSELVAMRAAGVSAWRFIFPAAGAAFLVGVFAVLVLSPGASWLDGQYDIAAARLSAKPGAPLPAVMTGLVSTAGLKLKLKLNAFSLPCDTNSTATATLEPGAALALVIRTTRVF